MIEEILYAIYELFVTFFYLMLELTVDAFYYFRRNPKVGILISIYLIATLLHIFYLSSAKIPLKNTEESITATQEILKGHLPVLGPKSTEGDFYLGPFYYYLSLPFFWLYNFDPFAAVMLETIFSIATVFLIYYVGMNLFGEIAGLFASSLYAISSFVISSTYTSSISDILPFFALLLIYMVYNTIKNARPRKFFVLTGILLGICLQLHYLAFILALVVVIYMLVAEWRINNGFLDISVSKHFLYFILGYIIGVAPIFLYDLTHNFTNTKGFFNYLSSITIQKGAPQAADSFTLMIQAFFRIFSKSITNFSSLDFTKNLFSPWIVFALFLAIGSLALLILNRNKYIALLFGMWLMFGVIFFGFFKKDASDYHFAFIFPLTFLLTGNLLGTIYNLFGPENKTEKRYMGTNEKGEEVYQLIPFKITNRKRQVLHILSILTSITIFTLICLANISNFPQ